jgi:lipoprotein-anchoring transpeptidase ErfK/SrfK
VPSIFKGLSPREKLKAIIVMLAIALMFCVFIAVIIRYSHRAAPPAPPVETGTVPVSGDVSSADALPGVVPEIAENVSSDVSVDTRIPPPGSRLAEDENGTFIVIDKSDFTMEIFRDGRTIGQYGIAVGKNTGDKRSVGDMRTPEGEFPIVQIQNSSKWTHDFKDGKGPTRGAYGPYFIRLGTPGWTGIGIHGTHAPDSIGTNVTEGCIRLNNEDVRTLRKMVKVGDKVVIRR